MRKTVVFNSLGRYGRFCNGAYQVASTIGIARRNGFDFAFPLWRNTDHAERFGSTEDVDLYKHFVNPLPVYDGPPLPDKFIHWGYSDVNLTESVSLSGHMQSTKYFEHAIDEVRWYFRMKDEPPQNDYTAIHVRLGDYDNGYHPRLDMRYYGPAMAQFPPSQKFLVFSDDIQSAKEMFGDTVEYSEGRNYIEDFKLLKSCRHFIVGNSTFSSFAAVLGEAKDKKVIAPSPWFGKKYTTITGADIYNEDWTIIDYTRQG